ncbi:MAG: hypothetical protein GTO00_09220 [Deltaproteobacteria bacterium]|nr:hypothetical protein [Deltaproteobacteria bacterium]
MYLYHPEFFISAVTNIADEKTVLVRARKRRDLTAFLELCCVHEIVDEFAKQIQHLKKNDYPYRLVLPKHEFSGALAILALQVNYPSVKDAVDPNRPLRLQLYYELYALTKQRFEEDDNAS